MRHNDNRDYGYYDNRYNRENDYNRNNQNYNHQNRQHERFDENGRQYRTGDNQGSRDDHYNEMYDIANYTGVPRYEDYGLPNGPENELLSMKPMPLQEGPYYGRRTYNYTLGNNPNFDNPEEGDMYRDFDSRGNHGYRHDASYGNVDEFRDFGNDHYGRQDRTNRPYYDDDRYNRY